MAKWKRIRVETLGAHKGKLWLTDGTNLALFKPNGKTNDGEMEVEVSRVAREIGISCAKVEPHKYWFKKGCLSYNVHDDNFMYRPAEHLFIKSGAYTGRSRNSNGVSLQTADVVSMQQIRMNEALKPLEKDAVDMLFLDCLVNNNDRHGGNWEIKLTTDGDILGIAPLYDHGCCIWKGNTERGKSRVYWNIAEEEQNPNGVSHKYMFEKLSEHYTEQIGDLLKRCENVKLNDFCAERFAEMKKIYSNTLNLLEIAKNTPERSNSETEGRIVELRIERHIGGTFTVTAEGATAEYRFDNPDMLNKLRSDWGMSEEDARSVVENAKNQDAFEYDKELLEQIANDNQANELDELDIDTPSLKL
jgi:hypothetical protein